MILKVFAVRDGKAELFMPPFFMTSSGAALRDFMDACNDPKSTLNRHPGDFQLYEIGNFDDQTGVLTSFVPMKLLGGASDFVKPVSAPQMAVPSAVDRFIKESVDRPLATVNELNNGGNS